MVHRILYSIELHEPKEEEAAYHPMLRALHLRSLVVPSLVPNHSGLPFPIASSYTFLFASHSYFAHIAGSFQSGSGSPLRLEKAFESQFVGKWNKEDRNSEDCSLNLLQLSYGIAAA